MFGSIRTIDTYPDKGVLRAACIFKSQNPMPQDFRGGKTGKVPSAQKIPLSGSYSAK